MYREINRKRIILEKRRPYRSEANAQLGERNQREFIETIERLSGSSLTSEQLAAMMRGEFIGDVALQEHVKLQRLKQLFSEMQSMCEMGTSLSLSVLQRLYTLFTGEEKIRYRKEETFLRELGYLPPAASETGTRLTVLFNWIGRDGEVYEKANPFETEDLADAPSDFILRAAYLHCRFLEIWPYEENTPEMALILMYYYLQYKGYPVFALALDRQAYAAVSAAYLRNGEILPFAKEIGSALKQKMDILIRMTAE